MNPLVLFLPEIGRLFGLSIKAIKIKIVPGYKKPGTIQLLSPFTCYATDHTTIMCFQISSTLAA